MIKVEIDIDCNKCRKKMVTGNSCYCQKCFGNKEEEAHGLLVKLEYTDNEIEKAKEEQAKKIIVRKQELKILFEALCKHQEEYESEKEDDFYWQDCEECDLCRIPWMATSEHERDLCFAIWHDEILA